MKWMWWILLISFNCFADFKIGIVNNENTIYPPIKIEEDQVVLVSFRSENEIEEKLNEGSIQMGFFSLERALRFIQVRDQQQIGSIGKNSDLYFYNLKEISPEKNYYVVKNSQDEFLLINEFKISKEKIKYKTTSEIWEALKKNQFNKNDVFVTSVLMPSQIGPIAVGYLTQNCVKSVLTGFEGFNKIFRLVYRHPEAFSKLHIKYIDQKEYDQIMQLNSFLVQLSKEKVESKIYKL